jgi:hypothetical protein
VVFWFVALLAFLIFFQTIVRDNATVFIVIISYRLFEIFESWVSQYLLGGTSTPWHPANPHRTLVILFEDYFAVTVSYAIFGLMFVAGVDSFGSAIFYSIRNAVTIGAEVSTPAGYAIFASQLLFSLLFLVAAVNRIISSLKPPRLSKY